MGVENNEEPCQDAHVLRKERSAVEVKEKGLGCNIYTHALKKDVRGEGGEYCLLMERGLGEMQQEGEVKVREKVLGAICCCSV